MNLGKQLLYLSTPSSTSSLSPLPVFPVANLQLFISFRSHWSLEASGADSGLAPCVPSTCWVMCVFCVSVSLLFVLMGRKSLLQFCVGFCCTPMRISHNFVSIYIPSLEAPCPPPTPPLQVITDTALGSLCYLATSHWLFVLHIYTSLLLSPFIPPHFPPLYPQVHSLPGSSVPFFF